MKSAASAAASAVVAIISSGAVANCAQTKSGMRVNVMPGARIFKIVTTKFMPVIVELTPTKKIAAAHIEVPAAPCSDTGGYSVQPAVGAPIRNDENSIKPGNRKDPEAQHVQPRKRDVARADLQREHQDYRSRRSSRGMMTSQTIALPWTL